jgi:RNA polymerase sigma factor (sigma-70 family)
MDLLTLLAKKHNDWLSMAYSFGLPKEEAEDLVQDMYLKMHKISQTKEFIPAERTYEFYVYITMRNLFYDNKKAEVHKIDIDTIRTLATEDQDHNKEELETLLDKMNQCIEELHWYDKKIFEIYYGRGETIRQLSAGTKISSSSIFNTIKNVRETIKDKCEKEYKDYSQE